ncbi:hypothetical protein [Acuticoccus sediminis]|uniref:hypothetical protein n=1 Tax=Acuticoccus sediminis TaxID=2184697 RepID=UPI001391CF12|nr:hypothetical protein [Acuticoccus sediminis]
MEAPLLVFCGPPQSLNLGPQSVRLGAESLVLGLEHDRAQCLLPEHERDAIVDDLLELFHEISLPFATNDVPAEPIDFTPLMRVIQSDDESGKHRGAARAYSGAPAIR